MKFQRLDALDLKDRSVFLRLDLNVPLRDGKISDDSRIRAALPTIEAILKQTGRLCIASHLGRPKSAQDEQYSLTVVGEELAKRLDREVLLMKDYDKEPVDQTLRQLGKNQIILLENLRFYPGENENDESFSENLIKGIDYYIDDAFGAVHREHASIAGAPSMMSRNKKAAGFLIDNELRALEKLKTNGSPFTVVLGGAKVSDKISVILNLLNYCNNLIIGGAMAYTFLKFKGHDVGKSKVEEGKRNLLQAIYEKAAKHNVRIYLPCDHLCAEKFDKDAEAIRVDSEDIPENMMGLDIGPNSIRDIQNILSGSKTIFWNGPLGVFEIPQFSEGTRAVARSIANLDAYSVVGGGDSLAAVNQEKLADDFSHVSTGGGASLEYLEGKKLPGLEALS